MAKKNKGPKILLLDIETAPILAYIWSLWDQNVGLNQIKTDWYILSWSAKWLDKKTVYYEDQSKAKNIEDDKAILKKLWDLLNEADICVTQNGKNFDHKKINARFAIHGMKPPSPFRIVDTYLIAKKNFAFTSNKLEYLSNKLNKKYKKLVNKNRKFHGFDLWRECLKGNKAAWREMKVYNKYDVLALEETFKKLIPWENNLNLNVYIDDITNGCPTCGTGKLRKNGWAYTMSGKYQRISCNNCGASFRESKNLHSTDKRKSLIKRIPS